MQRAECITLFSIHLQEYSCTFRGGFWNYFSMGELPVESCTFCSVDQIFFWVNLAFLPRLGENSRTQFIG